MAVSSSSIHQNRSKPDVQTKFRDITVVGSWINQFRFIITIKVILVVLLVLLLRLNLFLKSKSQLALDFEKFKYQLNSISFPLSFCDSESLWKIQLLVLISQYNWWTQGHEIQICRDIDKRWIMNAVFACFIDLDVFAEKFGIEWSLFVWI